MNESGARKQRNYMVEGQDREPRSTVDGPARAHRRPMPSPSRAGPGYQALRIMLGQRV